MNRLFEAGLQRLAGKSDQAVFELTQAMGGGKTHSMVALGLLAQNDSLRKAVLPDLQGKGKFEKATVVALSGRNHPEHFLWGEIAHQLGKDVEFKKFWQHGAKAPDEKAWKKKANAFDLRYSETVDPLGEPWEKCSEVLSRQDVVDRMSQGW